MKKLIAESIKKEVGLTESEIENMIEIPPSSAMGDFAFPCFSLSKQLRKSPQQIALDLKSKIKLPKGFSYIEASGPYLNFFLNRKKFAENLIKKILKEKDKFGSSYLGKKRVMIEFSQPNTHKAFHVGHIRGTSLGESLARISEFLGEKVIRANYSGDTGMHIAKWIWCYRKYHSKEELKDDEAWIASIYVDAVKRLSENQEFQNEVDEINRKIENKSDREINRLWKKTRKLSIKSWTRIYRELGTKFDIHYFESEVEKRGKEITNELLKKKIAKKSDGAVIVDLEKYSLGVLVLLRSDGTVLYSAKDLALAERKLREYKLDKSLIVIGNEQDTYFKQLFKTMELMKLKNSKIFSHIPFGMVRFPEGKMSSRTGDNILYSDFIKDVSEFAAKRLQERSLKIPKRELEKRALAVSIAAIKYSMLRQNPRKNIIFIKKDALNFEGDTGPYLLYSYARANSIIKKSNFKKRTFFVPELKPIEIELVKKLSQFSEIVLNAYKNFNPSLIANYSFELAKIFNEFYHACPVIHSENKEFRLKLVNSFKIVLRNSLNLLGIKTLEEM